MPERKKRAVHRQTVGQAPCGRTTVEVESTRDPLAVTCRSCRRIQIIPGAVVRLADADFGVPASSLWDS